MKNRIPKALRRLRGGVACGVAAGVLVLLLGLLTGVILSHQKVYVPENNVNTVNVERSQVYLSGSGYQIDKHQKDEHDEIENERQDVHQRNQVNPNQNNNYVRPYTPARPWSPFGPKAPGGKNKKSKDKSKDKKGKKKTGGDSSPGPTGPTKPDEKAPEADDPEDVQKPHGGDDGQTEEEKAKLPVVKTNIVDGDTVQGTRFNFWVTVTDYKGNNVPVYSVGEGKFTVSCNGEALSSTGENGKRTSFRVELVDGKNTFVIKAEDREGRARTVSKWVTCNASGEREKIGTVTVSIRAPILGLGTIYSTEVDIGRGDSAKDVIQEMFQKGGFTGIFSGSYLAGVKKTNIAKNVVISEETRAEMEERRRTEQDPDSQDPHSLKEKDFYDSSGWLYSVNGVFPEVGLSSKDVDDGDEVVLIFSLDDGVY